MSSQEFVPNRYCDICLRADWRCRVVQLSAKRSSVRRCRADIRSTPTISAAQCAAVSRRMFRWIMPENFGDPAQPPVTSEMKPDQRKIDACYLRTLQFLVSQLRHSGLGRVLQKKESLGIIDTGFLKIFIHQMVTKRETHLTNLTNIYNVDKI